jgi:hypothetical protein
MAFTIAFWPVQRTSNGNICGVLLSVNESLFYKGEQAGTGEEGQIKTLLSTTISKNEKRKPARCFGFEWVGNGVARCSLGDWFERRVPSRIFESSNLTNRSRVVRLQQL